MEINQTDVFIYVAIWNIVTVAGVARSVCIVHSKTSFEVFGILEEMKQAHHIILVNEIVKKDIQD